MKNYKYGELKIDLRKKGSLTFNDEVTQIDVSDCVDKETIELLSKPSIDNLKKVSVILQGYNILSTSESIVYEWDNVNELFFVDRVRVGKQGNESVFRYFLIESDYLADDNGSWFYLSFFAFVF